MGRRVETVVPAGYWERVVSVCTSHRMLIPDTVETCESSQVWRMGPEAWVLIRSSIWCRERDPSYCLDKACQRVVDVRRRLSQDLLYSVILADTMVACLPTPVVLLCSHFQP